MPRASASKTKLDLPALTPENFLYLVEHMPSKGAKELPASDAQSNEHAFMPTKWKKHWFASHIGRVTGVVKKEQATQALEKLLSREDGLDEYAYWLEVRLAKPNDPWMGFADHFRQPEFFRKVESSRSGVFRKIARRGKETAAAEERANEQFRLLGNISSSSSTIEMQLTDTYLRSRFTRTPQGDEWVMKQAKPTGVFHPSKRGNITRLLLSLEFSNKLDKVKPAVEMIIQEIAASVERDQTYASRIQNLEHELASEQQRIQRLESNVKKAQKNVAEVSREKEKIEDAGSDASRALSAQFDGLRLAVSSEIERLLKVAAEVARTVDDQRKRSVLVDQIDQVLSLGEDLKNRENAVKRAGGR